MKEIGSDFWQVELKNNDVCFLLSGRTALDYIIRDIKLERKIESVLLPSYCCQTMIEPFIRHNIKIRFYDIYCEEEGITADIPTAKNDEILFLIRYFGYEELKGIDKQLIRKQWCCIIEDCTHFWMQNDQSFLPDYQFSSYRKWTGFLGVASAIKYGGYFKMPKDMLLNRKYYDLREKAETAKEKYIKAENTDKEIYLSLFSQAENNLLSNYVNYSASNEEITKFLMLNVDDIKQKRINNANLLISEIKNISEIQLINSKIGENDIPLNVPVLVDNNKRDALRNFLRSKKIYCPIHWPLSKLHKDISKKASQIYIKELSLICDQRYSDIEIKREINAIKEFFKK